jgi:integrase
MPKTHTKPGTWVHDLRRQIKRQYGPGWSVIEQSAKVKLTRREEGSVMLAVPWAASQTTAILNEIGVIRSRMLERGMTLRDAAALSAAVESRVTGDGVVVASLNWMQVAEDFLKSRSDNRKNTTRPTAVRIEKALATLESKPKPTDGGSLMRAYAATHFANCKEGGAGRRRHLGDVGAFLRYAVERHGAPKRWLPLEGEEFDRLIGATERRVEDELTPPLKPDALARLLDEIKEMGDESLLMSVSLVACFGLRPCELAVLSVEDGKLYVGGGVKRSPQSKRRKLPPKPRYVRPLEIPGRSDGAYALRLLIAGTKFPKQLETQVQRAKRGEDALKAVGNKFARELSKVKGWQALVEKNPGITPYSLRHGYAWRAHKGYDRPIDKGTAANLMGHSNATHEYYYNRWIDEESTDASVDRALGISTYR